MTDLLVQAYGQFALFWLLFGRIGALLFVAPPFGSGYVPIPVRAFLALFLSLLFLPLAGEQVIATEQALPYFALLVREIVIGLAMGFLIHLIFTATQVAGYLLDLEMGLGLANLLDPVYYQPIPLMGQFFYSLALLLFFTIGGTADVLSALSNSLFQAPPGLGFLSSSSLQISLEAFAWMFLSSVRIALPVLTAAFLCNVVLAVLARAIPQMNAFVLGLQLKAFVILFGLLTAMPGLVQFMKYMLDVGLQYLRDLPITLAWQLPGLP